MTLGDRGCRLIVLGLLGIGVLGIIAALLAVIYTSPSPSSSGGSGGVNITFAHNGTGPSLLKRGFLVQSASGPRVIPIDLEMKFLSINLWTDYDTVHFKRVNDDPAPLVWQNPECAGIANNECNTNNVTKYFNFTQSLAAVNAEINSQHLPIPVGKYHYVQMGLCKHHLTNGSAVAGTDANFRFQAGQMNKTFAMVSNSCATWSTRADPPIEVTAGSTVSVYLTFTLEGLCVEADCSAAGMAHQPDHDVGGHIYSCVECDTPQFHISFTPPPVPSSSSSSSSTGVHSSSSSTAGGGGGGASGATGTGFNARYRTLKTRYDRELRARFPLPDKP